MITGGGAESAKPDLNYSMKLFVSGGEINSLMAIENLACICEAYLPRRHAIEIIDVTTDFEKALEFKVFITPTLMLMAPQPKVTVYGNLADSAKTIAALRLKSRP